VSLLQQLLSSVVEEQYVTIMEGVSDLEGIDDVSVLILHELVDLFGGKSVLIKTVVELDLLDESGL